MVDCIILVYPTLNHEVPLLKQTNLVSLNSTLKRQLDSAYKLSKQYIKQISH